MFLQRNFYHQGKKHRLNLNEHELTWNTEGTPDLRRTVLLSEIVSCWICPIGSLRCAFKSWNDQKECEHWTKGRGGLCLELSQRRDGHRWAASVVVFLHDDKQVLLTWHHCVWSSIRNLHNRPRRLLVIINPVSGRRKSLRIYQRKVAPLFKRANIETTELQTEYKGHGTRLIQDASSGGLLNDSDGIVAVGGDGLASEIVTGLFFLGSIEGGADPNDFRTDLPVTKLRVGIIPSGSTDAICFATHGSNDIVTAALHIIMGDKRAVDVATIHSEGALQRVVTSLVSYGYFGDILQSSESWRWLGPPRYVVSGLQQISKNKTYPVRMRIKKCKGVKTLSSAGLANGDSLSISPSCSSLCAVCARCDSTNGETDDISNVEEEWEEVSGNYSIVSAAISSCACRLTPKGVSPHAHLGDGLTDLILVGGSSRARLLSYLYHTSVTGNAMNLDHVKLFRTNEIHLTASPELISLFNCDGEELASTSLTIRIHRQKLQLFCRGVEDPVQSLKTKSTSLAKN